ncbi:MAG: hypothetical protein RBS57_21785 [Desulforhabdus sp.]|jgi:hypothetical protein|nr:hypothetical protein [Desulforhabdus sp.]
MKAKAVFWFVALAAIFCITSFAAAAEVSQGKCVSYNQEEKTITIEEYNLNFNEANPYGEPTGTVSSYNAGSAKMGIKPEPGDVVRIAYEVKGTDRVALKVMNVSKQDLRKK